MSFCVNSKTDKYHEFSSISTSFIPYALFSILKLIPNGTVHLLVCSLQETDILFDVLVLANCFHCSIPNLFVFLRSL